MIDRNLVASLLLSGVLAGGYSVAALFFLRFWRTSRDRLFLYFAAAFALLTVHRIMLSWAVESGGNTILFYVVRLVAFVLILFAIVDKNRAP
jgi:hypothetical protein